MISLHKALILIVKEDIFPPGVINYLKELLKQLIAFFSQIFPIFLNITIVMVNISLISGAIIYLLDDNNENGKAMIMRSFLVLIILISIFNQNYPNLTTITEPFEGFQSLTAFITSYLLFVFAALSLIIFLGNLGLYIISSNTKRIRNLKKSAFCLICIFLPLGFQFPNMPIWVM